MSENTAHVEVKMGSEKGFGIVFGCVFAIIACWPLFFGNDLRIWAAVISAVFFLLAFIYPTILAPLNKLWFQFGMFLGRFVAPIVMSLIYFLAVTPTGFVMRMLGHDLLRQKIDKSAKSYWIDREQPIESMKNQF